MPPGIHTSVTLPAELYPAIIENILPPDVRDQTRACLGQCLAVGNYPNAVPPNPNQNYVLPQNVPSPRRLLGPFRVVLNKRAGDGAYMIGMWGQREQRMPVIAFRWNGTDIDQRGFPISRGRPVWIILPDDLRAGFASCNGNDPGGPGPFIRILPPDERGPVIGFLKGQRALP